jgi:peptidyl-dipeptidase Dcp
MRIFGLTAICCIKALSVKSTRSLTSFPVFGPKLTTMSAFNPLLSSFESNEFGIPPFSKINPDHYKPAFEEAFDEHFKELKNIVDNNADPTFDNTMLPFDKAGGMLKNVGKVFHNLCSSFCPPELQTVQTQMAAPLAAHRTATYMYPGLFERIEAVYKDRLNSSHGYSSEQVRLIERVHLDFVRSGARFDAETQARYKKLMEDLAELTTKFSQVSE